MIINRLALKKVDVMELEEIIIFDKSLFDKHISLLDIKDVHVVCGVKDFDEVIRASIDVTATLILECAYTLKPFAKKVKVSDDLDFVFKAGEDDNQIVVTDKEINLNPYILGMIITEIPLRAVAPGAQRPKNGNGYRVISEEEYYKEKEQESDPRLAALDRFEE